MNVSGIKLNKTQSRGVRPEGDQKFEEKTLSEIGVTWSVPHWNTIQQPEKEELLDITVKMFRNFECTDLRVKIDQTEFICHMFVLKLYSEYFQKLDYVEKVDLPVTQVTPRAFEQVYAWMLDDNGVAKRENFVEVFNAAIFLSIPELTKQIWARLSNFTILTECEAFFLYLEACNYDTGASTIVIEIMLKRIEKFFLIVVASEDFLHMKISHIILLLSSTEICPRTEVDVFMAAIRWLFYNYNDRQIYLVKVMKCVRFGLFSPDLLIFFKNDCEVPEIRTIVQNEEILKILNTAISYSAAKKYSKDYASEIRSLRLSEPVERQWIYDENWELIKDKDDIGERSYSSFLKYLSFINQQDRDYWKQFKFVSQDTC